MHRNLAADLWAECWTAADRADPPAVPRGMRLAAFDPSRQGWSEHAESVAAWLAAENLIVVGDWADLLRPLRQPLTGR